MTPRDILWIDLIGPYTIKHPNNQTEKLWDLTMIDPATGWFDMTSIDMKRSDIIANKLEQTWITQYL